MNEIKTCFKRVDYDLSGLLHYIDIGDIALPDIQRPFVWSNAKVRDLFDSMYRGFPVGYLLFWGNGAANGVKQIGLDGKAHRIPSLLIVDGQQRLTSLYAVFRGQKVLDESYCARQIEIAFRPRDGKFEVTDAAIRKDPEFISNISELWSNGRGSYHAIRSFLAKLGEKAPVSDEGVKLNQADFILTLLSVFWEEGRKELEAFSRASRVPVARGDGASPFNHFIQPGPDQLLRVAVALGFMRGRLKSVYQVLRGKDLETGEFSPKRRSEQFERLQEAQARVLNLTHWHQFLSCLVGAGFRSGELVSSENALLYAYAFYLLGRIEHRVPEHVLQRLIGRWFYASTLSGRYTGSPETVMDGDLNRVRDLPSADAYVSALERIIASTLTPDFWTITLPNALDSSSARNPELFAYHASQNKLGAPVLFSHKRISDLLDPALRTKKRATERHHLFPRAWLERQGITDLKLINQTANMALLEWPENLEISDKPPQEYVPLMRARFSQEDWKRMCQMHALPEGWETMGYEEFLAARRPLMAQIIKRGLETLQ